MEKNSSRYNRFRQMYNKTIKGCLNLPGRAPHEKIDVMMGVQSARNIIQANFIRNYNLWMNEF